MTLERLADGLATWLDVSGAAVLTYFILVNTSYLLLLVLATVEFVRHARRHDFAGYDDALASPLTLPVSVLLPAHDEEAGIVESVQAMLGLRYAELEVVVIDDGSTDGTFAALQAAFDLVEVPRVIATDVPTRGRVLSVHVPARSADALVVVRKENGGKADALNTGVNVARYPLVCTVDADSLLDPDALLRVAKPFADDPDRVVATGGVIRAVNGSTVRAGRVVDLRMPRQRLAAVQVVEYLRAFLLGRSGWSRLGALLVISGAFGLFRRDVVVEVGGLDSDVIGEDAELVLRIHRHLREQRRDYRIVFVAEPVSWTEVPATRAVLARQRRRWHRGLTEILWKHRALLLNPRYGRIGLVAVPYFLVFELLAPVVELIGVVVLAASLLLEAVSRLAGEHVVLVSPRYAVLFLGLAYAYAFVLSLAALVVEEFSWHRYSRWRDLGSALIGALLENVGYRQATAWWRLQGILDVVRRTTPTWGTMTRSGFQAADPVAVPARVPAALPAEPDATAGGEPLRRA
jgi:cellulose synthase/poly-beta-1,6-N-acetylglucosamine synthase-like glycosyltransferase